MFAELAAAAGCAGAIAGGCAYASRWPTSQLFGRTLVAGKESGEQHSVALTYDDGPGERWTEPLLDLLAEHKVRATFFLIGAHVRKYPATARRVAEAGHTVGNHTAIHPDLARKSVARIRQELADAQAILSDETGALPRFFRPPYGSRRPAVLRIARELGLEPVLWNVAANDWQSIGAEAMLRRVVEGMERNCRHDTRTNLLLHDASHLDSPGSPLDRGATLAVTKALLQRDKLRFITVDELA